jgi:hypothetical protein
VENDSACSTAYVAKSNRKKWFVALCYISVGKSFYISVGKGYVHTKPLIVSSLMEFIMAVLLYTVFIIIIKIIGSRIIIIISIEEC